MEIKVNGKDISAWIEKVTWSGDCGQIARKLSFTYAFTREDSNIPLITVDNGARVAAYDGVLFFLGVVTGTSRQEAGVTVSVNAVDLAWYTGKVKTYGVYQGTPAEIVSQVCGEYGIPVGELLEEGTATEIISTGDKTIYQVMEDAYGETEHYLYMSGDVLNIMAAGMEVAAHLSGNTDITDATYTSSIESMVNKVVILDGSSSYAGEVTREGQVSAYGLMQETYKQEQGKDAAVEASKLLKGVEESGNISAQGNILCIAGKAVYITDVNTNITGCFRITSDTHNFEGTLHTMSLTLEFKEVV